MSKPVKIICIVCAAFFALLLTALSCTSAALSALTFIKVNELERQAGSDYYGEDVAREDDVKIAGDYEIKSTKNISDAYISGNTGSLSDRDKETLDMAKKVIDEVITDGMTDYEKELAIYDWMTATITGDDDMLAVINTNYDDDNPYGALKYHSAVCVGYATTFRMFMQMLEIDCKVVHNSEMFHSWDLVKLGDGWYHVDVYSDAGKGGYAHFNLTDEMMDNEWNTDFFPAADKYDYCYAVINAVEEKDIYKIPALLREALDGGERYLSLKFAGMGEDDKTVVEAMLYELEDKLLYSEEYGENYIYYNNLDANGDYVVYITIYQPEDYEGIDYDDLPEGADEKIEKAIEKSFGDLTELDYDDIDFDEEAVYEK